MIGDATPTTLVNDSMRSEATPRRRSRASSATKSDRLGKVQRARRQGRGRYRIGWRIVELNETLRATTDIRSHARPVMQHLVDQLGEPSTSP